MTSNHKDPSTMNRDTSFTPGPWRFDADNFDGVVFVVEPTSDYTGRFRHIARNIFGVENTRLIAAAPEMFEALEVARSIIQDERDTMVECATMPPDYDVATLDDLTKPYVEAYDAALAKIDAALAKARGESSLRARAAQ